MMKPLLIGQIPIAPSTNALVGINTRKQTNRTSADKKATVYTLPEVKAWREAAVMHLYKAQHFTENIHACRDNDMPLYMSLIAYLPLDRLLRRDADNFVKAVQDVVLNKYLAIDDVRVFDVHVSKRLCPPDTEPYIFVSVYEQESMYVEGLKLPHRKTAIAPISRMESATRTTRTRATSAAKRRDVA